MKELSIEEKAKCYDEALERARNLHKDAIDMKENLRAKQCEIIFPELAESEDDRIRKALIRFHKSTIDVDGIKGEDIIAWLEKQGKQKPAWSEDDGNRINRLIAYFEDKESFTAEDDVVYANWLKSLKERYTWKPSDEQMKVLEAMLTVSPQSPAMTSELIELYQQLKRLKG